MDAKRYPVYMRFNLFLVLITIVFMCSQSVLGADLVEIKKRGVLRHLGVPYANFVTGSGDGLDVEMMKLFAQYLGVEYQYVKTSWKTVISDLIGREIEVVDNDVNIKGKVPIRGDLIANGMTILPWRQKVLNFAAPNFPTQVWLIARHDSSLSPITPAKDIQQDILSVKSLLRNRTVMGKSNTCLDPQLYNLKENGIKYKYINGSLNELAPAIINGEAESTLLDVPDALIAMEKWSGKIKVIGPISEQQVMACAFPKSSPKLRSAYNLFFEKRKKDGTYLRLVKKYYPGVFNYYADFFENS
jgi:ABC-type amino acid transport substrate-binding protein